ncbi:glycosyltransferase, partial [Bacteroidota bacterium]
MPQKFPYVKLIVNENNIGFGAANNQAMKISKGKFLVMLNPDTIVRENTFTELIDFFNKTPSCGLLGCKVLNPDGSLQLPCRRSFPGPWTAFTRVTGLSILFPKSRLFARYNLTYLDENSVNEVDAISGAFMMLRREVYENIGGFDIDFFMYGEDLDFCYRTQTAGYKVYYVPTTEIIHYKGESTKRSNLDETKIFYNAMHLFVRKHLSTSIIVEWILRTAIFGRKIISFFNIYKLPILSSIADLIFFALSMRIAEDIYKTNDWLGFPKEVVPWVYVLPAVVQLLISIASGAYKKKTLSILKILLSLIFGFVFLTSLTFFL